MTQVSTRSNDMAKEQILGRFLDLGYQDTALKDGLSRITGDNEQDRQKQERGIDLQYQGNGRLINIDEKAQLSYINKSLPTFAFELSSLQKSKTNNALYLTGGWLFADESRNMTDYYILVTDIFLKKEAIQAWMTANKEAMTRAGYDDTAINHYIENCHNSVAVRKDWYENKAKSIFNYAFHFNLQSEDDIESCLVTKVKKSELIDYLSNMVININYPSEFMHNYYGSKLTKTTCDSMSDALRAYIESNDSGKKTYKFDLCKEAGSSKPDIALVYTHSLAEKPINIVIRLESLLKLQSTTQYKFAVDDNGSVRASKLYPRLSQV